jgi:hypothetical protein
MTGVERLARSKGTRKVQRNHPRKTCIVHALYECCTPEDQLALAQWSRDWTEPYVRALTEPRRMNAYLCGDADTKGL